MTVKPIPDGYHAVTPYLTVRGAAKVIEFLKKAFGAETTQAQLYVYVPNADATYQRAMAAGATSSMAPTDMFYGDRSGSVKDPTKKTWAAGAREASRSLFQAAKGKGGLESLIRPLCGTVGSSFYAASFSC